jgi:hypothetical protein
MEALKAILSRVLSRPRGIRAQRPEEEAMPLVIKEQEGQFEVAPPGLHEAVCVDVVDLGMVDGKFGPKRKLKLIWQLKGKNKLGERYQARASYTQSLMEGSNLRRDLESWRGRAFTDVERKAFDVEKLIGVNCQLSLKHNISKSTGRTYAQVTVVLPPLKGASLKPEKYVREPWPSAEPPQSSRNDPEMGPETYDDMHNVEDDVPF